jgi:hypothetical protein
MERWIVDDSTTRGRSFERICLDLLGRLGFENCRETAPSNDQGADILGDYDGDSYLFQCKDHRRPVGNNAVQQAVTAKPFYRAAKCGVISRGSYTKSASALARVNYCLLFIESELQAAVDSGESFDDLLTGYQPPASIPVEHDYDVIKVYRETKVRCGHTPRNKDFDASTRYRIKKIYGNLTNLIESVGDSPYSKRPSDDDIVGEYKRVRAIVGEVPTLADMTMHSSFSRNCFASFPFRKLQRRCGDRPNVERGVGKQELIDAYRELRRTLGRNPSVTELDEKGDYRASLYRRRWGNMDGFRREMGIPRGELGQRSYKTRELAALFLLLEAASAIRADTEGFQLGYTGLEGIRWADEIFVSPTTISRRFESWDSFRSQMTEGASAKFSSDLAELVSEFLRGSSGSTRS